MRKLLSSLIYVFFGLPIALSALMLLSVRPWALDRGFYHAAVADERLYSALKDPNFTKDIEGSFQAGGYVFDTRSAVMALQRNFPEAELKDLAAHAVDSTLDGIEGKTPGRISIDEKAFKAALASRSAALARDYAAALPVKDSLPGQGDLRWRTAAQQPSAIAAPASKAVASWATSLPDSLTATISPNDLKIAGMAAGAGLSQSLLDRWAALNAVLAAVLLSGLAVLGGSSAGLRLARGGKMLLLPSLVVLAAGAFLALPGSALIGNAIASAAQHTSGMEDVAAPAWDLLRTWFAATLGKAAGSFLLVGVVGASLGGMLVSTKRFVEPKEIE